MDQKVVTTEERRKHKRDVRIGLLVRLSGQTYEVSNWSMGGFLLEGYEGSLSTGALVTVEGLGCRETGMHTVNLPARVVRTGEHTLAVSYLGLDPAAYDFLTQALSRCGEMRALV